MDNVGNSYVIEITRCDLEDDTDYMIISDVLIPLNEFEQVVMNHLVVE